MTKDEALKLALEALDCALSENKPYIVQCKKATYAIKEVLAKQEAETHLQAVSDFGQLQAQIEERNFCHRCGTRLMGALGPVSLHTCCPPHGRTFDDYGNKIERN